MTGPDVHETHVSLVWRHGDRAYKRKKPVKTSYLDYSTRRRREAACRREVDLNRRLSPDVYLGVDHVRLDDTSPAEPVVVMRWLPDGSRLDHLVARGDPAVVPALRAVARQLAALHARSPEWCGDGSPGSWIATRRRWDGHLADLAELVPDAIGRRPLDEIEELVARFLAGRRELFERRVSAGRVRDGHGDLRCDQIFLTPDGPRILDCIDFDDELRCEDVLLDACFLAMDLEWCARPDLAAAFLAAYEDYTGWPQPVGLRHFFVAERAIVRAKVAGLRARQAGRSDGEGSRRAMLADRHLRRAVPKLVLVGGLPGSGKTTLAQRVAARHEMSVLSSDAVRKQLAGIPVDRPAGSGWETGIYSAAHTTATYAELLARAAALLRAGESVVLDATWSDALHRRAAAGLARRAFAVPVAVECRLPEAEAERRIRRRTGTASDADVATRARMRERWRSWPGATAVTTLDLDAADGEVAQAIERAVGAVTGSG